MFIKCIFLPRFFFYVSTLLYIIYPWRGKNAMVQRYDVKGINDAGLCNFAFGCVFFDQIFLPDFGNACHFCCLAKWITSYISCTIDEFFGRKEHNICTIPLCTSFSIVHWTYDLATFCRYTVFEITVYCRVVVCIHFLYFYFIQNWVIKYLRKWLFWELVLHNTSMYLCHKYFEWPASQIKQILY